MQFTGEDSERFAVIHKLLRKHQLQVMGSVFNSQAEVDRAYEQTAELMTRSVPHEAGHAVVGLALGAAVVRSLLVEDAVLRNAGDGFAVDVGLALGALRARLADRVGLAIRAGR